MVMAGDFPRWISPCKVFKVTVGSFEGTGSHWNCQLPTPKCLQPDTLKLLIVWMPFETQASSGCPMIGLCIYIYTCVFLDAQNVSLFGHNCLSTLAALLGLKQSENALLVLDTFGAHRLSYSHIYAQQMCETMLNQIWHVTQKKV